MTSKGHTSELSLIVPEIWQQFQNLHSLIDFWPAFGRNVDIFCTVAQSYKRFQEDIFCQINRCRGGTPPHKPKRPQDLKMKI